MDDGRNGTQYMERMKKASGKVGARVMKHKQKKKAFTTVSSRFSFLF
jgi:hypothetical protein